MSNRAFEVIDEALAPAPKAEAAGTAMLLLGLKSLSQRAIAAVADLFALATVGSAFWLSLSISAQPTTYQLVLAGTYDIFVLLGLWIVRRGR